MEVQSVEQRVWTWLRRLGWAGIAAGLIIPVIGVNVTPAWNWTTSDFILAYAVLITSGLLVEGFAAIVKNARARIGFGMVVVVIFFAIWAWAVA